MHMKKLPGKRRKTPNKLIEYLWTIVIFSIILWVIAIPDRIYYYHPAWWSSGSNPIGAICSFARQRGWSYTGVLRSLKNNFEILVTAMSVIITMSVNNLNRFENKIFGLTRNELDFSKRLPLYRYGRRMVLFAPLVMIIALILNFAILGYLILILCYLFIVIAYFLFESSFSHDKDLKYIGRMMLESVPQNIQDQEDIADYRMLLNRMSQWNGKEKYWEGVNSLFWELCAQAKKEAIEKRYILCCCFYETMYLRNNETDCDSAVYALKEYIKREDRQGWVDEDYLVLWGMLHCLFAEGEPDSVFRFIKWYMDFPVRSRKLERKYNQDKQCEGNGGYRRRIASEIMYKQTGLILVEMELFFHSFLEHEKIHSYIWNKISQIWDVGKCILDEKGKELREKYLEINEAYDLGMDGMDKLVRNLCLDYQNNTTRSMMAYYVKYK